MMLLNMVMQSSLGRLKGGEIKLLNIGAYFHTLGGAFFQHSRVWAAVLGCRQTGSVGMIRGEKSEPITVQGTKCPVATVVCLVGVCIERGG